jgi:membrane-associated phospholipid phosphatase
MPDKVLLAVLSALGAAAGLGWRVPKVAALDERAAAAWNRLPLPHGVDRILIGLRPLGTKWVWVGALAALILAGGVGSLWIAGGAAAAALVERLIKIAAGRPRPSVGHPDIVLRQAPAPADSSFPSGDAMRVWFVVCALEMGLPAAWAPVRVLVWTAAVTISLGRVRLGAHYPLDVWSGGWIGIGCAAAAGALAG